MIRYLMSVIVLGEWLCACAQPPSPAPEASSVNKKVLASVTETQPVHFDQPVTFWRHGSQFQANDAILLRVQVGKVFEFQPRGIGPPLFVYGESVCVTVKSPLADGLAVVLAPPPSPGPPPLLWLSPPGMEPKELDQAQTARLLKAANVPNPIRAISVPAPASTVKATHYRNLTEARKEFNR